MSLELKKYLMLLRQNASVLERTNINNVVDNSFTAKYSWRIAFLSISGALVFFSKKGFNADFVSFLSSLLSIFIGLFTTALIFSFDKFTEDKSGKSDISNARIALWSKQAYNYAKKFAFITGYTIVLSVFSLCLLFISSLFPNLEEININDYFISFKFLRNQPILSLKYFSQFALIFLIRFAVLYFFLRILYNTLFIVSSMVQYMTIKMDRNKQ